MAKSNVVVPKGTTKVELPAQVKSVLATKAAEVAAPVAKVTAAVATAQPVVAAKAVVAPAKLAVVPPVVAKPVVAKAPAKEKKIGVFKITSVNPKFEYLGGSQDIDIVFKEYMVGANLDNSRSVSAIRAEFKVIQAMKKYAGKTAEEVFTLEILELAESNHDLPALKAEYGLKEGLANLKMIQKKAVVEEAAPVAAPVKEAAVAKPVAKVTAAKVVEPEPEPEEEEEAEEEVDDTDEADAGEEEAVPAPVATSKNKTIVKGNTPIDYQDLYERYQAGIKVHILCKEAGITSGQFYSEIRKFSK